MIVELKITPKIYFDFIDIVLSGILILLCLSMVKCDRVKTTSQFLGSWGT